MGRKGNSKRKPKANSGPFSKTNPGSNLTESVKDKGAPLNKAGLQPLAEATKILKKEK